MYWKLGNKNSKFLNLLFALVHRKDTHTKMRKTVAFHISKLASLLFQFTLCRTLSYFIKNGFAQHEHKIFGSSSSDLHGRVQRKQFLCVQGASVCKLYLIFHHFLALWVKYTSGVYHLNHSRPFKWNSYS